MDCLLSTFVISIVLGAYTQTYVIPVFYLVASIILMSFAYWTRNWKWISAFFFFCILVAGVVGYFLLLWIGYEVLGGYNDNLAMLYCTSLILLLIILCLYHYYYTNWRYEGLIDKDNFSKSNGQVHIFYFWHSIFLLVVSTIMFIVNACFANFYFFFCFLSCDLLRIIGVGFGFLGQKKRGIYYCTCYYRPLCSLATIIGLVQAFLVFWRYELLENKILQYFNSAFEFAFVLSAIICNYAKSRYRKYTTI